jgi:hypothetical protein
MDASVRIRASPLRKVSIKSPEALERTKKEVALVASTLWLPPSSSRPGLGDVTIQSPAAFATVAGKSVSSKVGGRAVALGNTKLMADFNIALGEQQSRADELCGDTATVLSVVVYDQQRGSIAIANGSNNLQNFACPNTLF